MVAGVSAAAGYCGAGPSDEEVGRWRWERSRTQAGRLLHPVDDEVGRVQEALDTVGQTRLGAVFESRARPVHHAGVPAALCQTVYQHLTMRHLC